MGDFGRIFLEPILPVFVAESLLRNSQRIDQQALEDCEQLSYMIFKHTISILAGFGIFKTGKLLAYASVTCDFFKSEKYPDSRCLKSPQVKCVPTLSFARSLIAAGRSVSRLHVSCICLPCLRRRTVFLRKQLTTGLTTVLTTETGLVPEALVGSLAAPVSGIGLATAASCGSTTTGKPV